MRPRPARVNRAFANVGKAIAAYERGSASSPRASTATWRGDEERADRARSSRACGSSSARRTASTATAARCFTNGEFHNTGVRPDAATRPRGGVARVLRDEFNCLGAYSDAPARQCAVRFVPARVGAPAGRVQAAVAPRTSTRNAPYMHAGQLATLGAVLRHYNRARPAAVGHSELHPLELSERAAGRARGVPRDAREPVLGAG